MIPLLRKKLVRHILLREIFWIEFTMHPQHFFRSFISIVFMDELSILGVTLKTYDDIWLKQDARSPLYVFNQQEIFCVSSATASLNMLQTQHDQKLGVSTMKHVTNAVCE